MHQNVVNDIIRHPDDKPTIGLLLVKGKNETVVVYSLDSYQNPIGVAEWKNQMAKALLEEFRSSLPAIEDTCGDGGNAAELWLERKIEGLNHEI